jgi:hypothetical protein
MSIDTYDTLAMVRRGATGRYSLDWIELLARDVTSGTTVRRQNNALGVPMIVLERDGAELQIYFSAEPHVLVESDEIAGDEEGFDCAGAMQRFELFGTDLELVLMNDHLTLCERLEATGDFRLYSGQNGPYSNWT